VQIISTSLRVAQRSLRLLVGSLLVSDDYRVDQRAKRVPIFVGSGVGLVPFRDHVSDLSLTSCRKRTRFDSIRVRRCGRRRHTGSGRDVYDRCAGERRHWCRVRGVVVIDK